MVGLGEGEGSGEKGGEEEKEGRPLNHHHHTAQAALFFNPLPPSLSHFSRFFFLLTTPCSSRGHAHLTGSSQTGTIASERHIHAGLARAGLRLDPGSQPNTDQHRLVWGFVYEGGTRPHAGSTDLLSTASTDLDLGWAVKQCVVPLPRPRKRSRLLGGGGIRARTHTKRRHGGSLPSRAPAGCALPSRPCLCAGRYHARPAAHRVRLTPKLSCDFRDLWPHAKTTGRHPPRSPNEWGAAVPTGQNPLKG